MKKYMLIFLLISSTAFGQYSDHEKSHIGKDDIAYSRIMLTSELNDARSNPIAYGDGLDIDLSMHSSSKQLTTDRKLQWYAQWYANELLENSERFEHSAMEFPESILWNYDVCTSIEQFIIDKDVPSLGHRKHLLNPDYGFLGIGIAKGWVGEWYRTYVVILTR
jgi:hypothetical protein